MSDGKQLQERQIVINTFPVSTAEEATGHDLFISYASPDREFAEELDALLRRNGIRTFFDRSSLEPGAPWLETLELAINQARGVAILVGARGLGNIQQYERAMALVRQSRDKTFLVIPILVPGCDALPTGFLELLTWVDLRQGLRDAGALTRLLEALGGKTPASTASTSVRDSICPYMGLEPFREEDAAFFCGRVAVIEELVAKVGEHPLVAVIGRSGSGKSSLVFAGLLPALRRERPRLTWDVLVVRPGVWPLHALAAAFEGDSARTGTISHEALLDAAVAELRTSDDDILGRVASRRSESAAKQSSRLLLYVDQWEELYSMGPTHDDRARERHAADVDRFITLLAAIARDPRAHTRVVLTLRADFYEMAMGHAALGALLPRQQVNIGRLSREDVRSIIRTPALKAGLDFEPASLVDEILDDVGTDESVLPLLQHALKQTWARRRGNLLTAEGYTEAGGVSRAIEKAADGIYRELGADDQRRTRQLFLGLVTPGEGREDTRARIPMPTDPALRALVAKFTAPGVRLLTAGSETVQPDERGPNVLPHPPAGTARSQATLEVAHEALIRCWPELRSWVEANRDVLRARAAIVQRCREWETNGRRSDLLLPSGFQVERARELLSMVGDVPVEDIQHYVEASIREEESRVEALKQAELEERRRLKRRARDRFILAVLSLLAAGALGVLAIIAYSQANAAALQAARADFELAERHLEMGGKEVPAAIGYLARSLRSRPDFFPSAALLRDTLVNRWQPRALTLTFEDSGQVRALTTSPDGRTILTVSETGIRLWDANTGKQKSELVHARYARTFPAAFSPDGRYVIGAHGDITVWDASTGRQVGGPLRHEGDISAVAMSPDGLRALTASSDGSARVWDVSRGELVFKPLRHDANEAGVTAATFSADGRRVLTISREKMTEYFDIVDGKELRLPIILEAVGPRALALSPEGDAVVITRSDAVVELVDIESGKARLPALLHQGAVVAVVFSPDGRRIATLAQDNALRIWDSSTGKLVCDPIRVARLGDTATFSPDGDRILTVSGDNSARSWNTSTCQAISEPLSHPSVIRASALGRSGHIVTVSGDGVARIWDVSAGAPSFRALDQQGDVESATFSPDGGRIVTISGSTARVWHTRSGQPIGEPLRHTAPVRVAVVSPDGRRIVTASGDGSVRLWDATIGMPIGPILRHEHGVSLAIFNRDGSRVFTASAHAASTWDTATGRLLSPPVRFKVRPVPVHLAMFDPTGVRILTASGFTARLWDGSTGESIAELSGHRSHVRAADFSPDGSRIVTGDQNGTTRIWDAKTGKLLFDPLQHEGGIDFAAFSPNGQRALVVSGRSVRFLDVTTGDVPYTAIRVEKEIGTAEFSPDARRVVTTSWENTARIWDADGREATAPLLHDQPVRVATFSPDGRHVITAAGARVYVWDQSMGPPRPQIVSLGEGSSKTMLSPDGNRLSTATASSARIWDAFTGAALSEPLRFEGRVRVLAFSPDGSKVATRSEELGARSREPRANVDVWDIAARKAVCDLKHDKSVGGAAFSSDGRRIMTWSESEPSVRVWDVSTNALVSKPVFVGYGPGKVAFSPQGTRVAASFRDGKVNVVDLVSGKPSFEPLRHEREINVLAFSSDGRRLVTASQDGTARVWDASSGKALCEPLRHDDPVYEAVLSPDGSRLVTSARLVVRIWDVSTGRQLVEPLREKASELALSPNGRLVATGSSGEIRIWDAGTGKSLGHPLRHVGITQIAFSPDGGRIVSASGDRVFVWSLDAPELPTPEWFTAWAEGLRGKELLMPSAKNELAKYAGEAGGGRSRQLAAWLLASGSERTAWPGARLSTRKWVDDRVAEGNVASLADAYDALPGDPLVLAASAEMDTKRETALSIGSLRARVVFEATYAVRHLDVYSDVPSRQQARRKVICDRASTALRRAGLDGQSLSQAMAPCGTP